ncbi:MAG: 3-dehydroquinate synthase II [Euryarchaeota archaeon]|nr:3-dehydroquinate synthase II [Euryarchaeota archaeon]|tara:strand:+ start:3746 stop:4735 length:990 start_codon:yes stop_codon:yes gene_type:complete
MDCDMMQIWLESGEPTQGVDLILGENLQIDGEALYIEGKQVGRRVDVSNSEGQSKARAMAGSVEWILLDLGEWKMIPIENIIAACDGGPTKVAARISSPEQVLGAAFALQIGVDALLVDEKTLQTALIAKSQRGEVRIDAIDETAKGELELSFLEVVEVSEGGVGDRVCVDLTSLLDPEEGMIVGSSSKSMVLVHGETVESEFVPTRPFRVNAGASHSYIMMADGTTSYLSELKMGDEVLVVNGNEESRSCVVGRVKIEKRPFILFRWKNENDNEAGVLLQQAETVRLISESHGLVSVTELVPGMKLLGWNGGAGRHVGQTISAEVDER